MSEITEARQAFNVAAQVQEDAHAALLRAERNRPSCECGLADYRSRLEAAQEEFRDAVLDTRVAGDCLVDVAMPVSGGGSKAIDAEDAALLENTLGSWEFVVTSGSPSGRRAPCAWANDLASVQEAAAATPLSRLSMLGARYGIRDTGCGMRDTGYGPGPLSGDHL